MKCLIYFIVIITLCTQTEQMCQEIAQRCIDHDSCCERLGCIGGICVPRLGGRLFLEAQRVCGKMMDDCESNIDCCDKLQCYMGKCMRKKTTLFSFLE
jgi:hypothetical protein